MSGKQIVYLNTIIEFLPSDMWQKRMKMEPTKKGFKPGIRAAAKDVGISPTTYTRAENGENIDLETLRKILNWIGI